MIEEAVARLKDHAIVGFSTYIWNRSYNTVLARELKKANPNILILVGGPEYPIEKPHFFKTYPFIDICAKLEGEKSFKKILEHFLTDKDYKSIPGLLINDNGKTIDTGDAIRIDDLDTIPSPYLTDVFKSLMEKHPEIRWNATLETNRGCPYACTFCDWGSLTYNKVKKFNLERVFHELEWIGKNKCDFVSLTDANFGIFPERDSMIADKLIAVQKEYDNPKAYTIAWAKNQKREVVEIVRKLIYEGGSKMGLNLSVQSMDDNVLEIIKRTNLEMNKIKEFNSIIEASKELNIGKSNIGGVITNYRKTAGGFIFKYKDQGQLPLLPSGDQCRGEPSKSNGQLQTISVLMPPMRGLIVVRMPVGIIVITFLMERRQ